MTDRDTQAFPIGGVPLPTSPENWQLEEIVYTKYTYDELMPPGHRVIAKIRSYAVPETNIEQFVKARLRGDALPARGRVRPWPRKDPQDDRPTNIYIGRECWVVIELDRNVDWHFEPGQPGITTLRDHGNNNCDLMHVMDQMTRRDRLGPHDTDCRLIYFVVQRRPSDHDHQRFICNIIHGNKRLDDPDTVDPDIPNDGGRFPIPFTDPPGKLTEADE